MFPRREEFARRIAAVPNTLPLWAGQEGPRFRLELSPGSIRVTSTDYAKKNASENAARERMRKEVDDLVRELTAPDDERRPEKPKRGAVKAWSARSRSRMTLRLATLDYSPLFAAGRPPAMVTLTMPHDWQTVAPTAPAFKKIVNRWRDAYRRQWGEYVAGVWKMEFQWRKRCAQEGCHDPAAPHLHIIMTPPGGAARASLSLDDRDHLEECDGGGCTRGCHAGVFEFAEWLSRSWADAVRHPDEEERRKHERAGTGVDYDELSNYADPKRIGVYFSKHGLYAEKEYQNTLPASWRAADEGGANFWGYWVVRPLIVSKEAHEALVVHIVRHLRALADRNAYSRQVTQKWVHEEREVTALEWVVDVETGEMRQELQSTWVKSSRLEKRKRKVRKRVKRWRSLHGFEVVNDSLARVDSIVRIMQAHIPAIAEAEGFDLSLLDRPVEPDWFQEEAARP